MGRPHHHAYVWLGHGSILVRPGDKIRRPTHPEFRASPVMPLQRADWLLKAPALLQGTFDEPKEAAHWYAAQLEQHAGLFTGPNPPEADHTDTVRALAAGEDVVGGWWVTGDRFLSLNLITCPHPFQPEYTCPKNR